MMEFLQVSLYDICLKNQIENKRTKPPKTMLYIPFKQGFCGIYLSMFKFVRLKIY